MSEPFFKKIRVIRKLNEPDSEKIDVVVEQINRFADQYDDVAIVSESNVDSSTLFIGIGGDGTTMRAASQAAAVQGTVLGINCGNLGFLSEFKADTVVKLLTDLYTNAEGVFTREKRSVLMGSVHEALDKHLAVNDFYITSASKTCIAYDLFVDGEKIASQQRADGVIVCSPTGSTAYGLAAGGGIILPTCKVMQIVAVAPHALANRPIVVPTDTNVSVQVNSDQDVQLYVDGQKKPFPLNDKGIYEVKIRTNQRKYFHFVKSSSRDHNFFKIIQEKLG